MQHDNLQKYTLRKMVKFVKYRNLQRQYNEGKRMRQNIKNVVNVHENHHYQHLHIIVITTIIIYQ